MATLVQQDDGSKLSYPFTDNVRLGQFVDVELQNATRDRFKTTVVGCKEDEYLILMLPDTRKYGFLKDRLEDKEKLVIRTIFEKTSGDCVAFNTAVICKTSHPDRLLYVDYPRAIVHKPLRREGRQEIHLPARIFQSEDVPEEKRIKGMVTNISHSGCRFECELSESISVINPEDLVIELILANGKETQRIHAELRSQRKEKNQVYIGFSFVKSGAVDPLFAKTGLLDNV